MIYPDYPFESRFVEIDGQRIHYVDEGQGEVILMLHGNPTWSYLWRHVILGLRDEYRCIALDHLGFGFSDKPRRGDYTMRAHIMRLDSFVSKLGLRDVTLAVQDWGGIIGLGWAVRHKELVKRLVVLNTAGFALEARGLGELRSLPRAFPLLWALKLPIVGELFVQGMNGFVRQLLPMGIHHKERLDAGVMEAYLDPYQTWHTRRAHLLSARQIPLLHSHPTWRLLKEIGAELDGWEVPAQMIWGMRDPVFTPAFLEEFERRLPNHAPSVRLENASHFLQDDEPEPIVRATRKLMQNTVSTAAGASATSHA